MIAGRTVGWLDKLNHKRRSSSATRHGGRTQAWPSIQAISHQGNMKVCKLIQHGADIDHLDYNRLGGRECFADPAERNQAFNVKTAITVQCQREDCS